MQNDREAEAIDLIRKSGEDFERIAQVTGFNPGKLFQWFKLGRFPSLKVAKSITKSLGKEVERQES